MIDNNLIYNFDIFGLKEISTKYMKFLGAKSVPFDVQIFLTLNLTVTFKRALQLIIAISNLFVYSTCTYLNLR